eukprot:361491-Chlamydomonas_euryale.AAC.5
MGRLLCGGCAWRGGGAARGQVPAVAVGAHACLRASSGHSETAPNRPQAWPTVAASSYSAPEVVRQSPQTALRALSFGTGGSTHDLV